MAANPAASSSRLRNAGIRRLDNLVSGLFCEPERVSGLDRVCGDVPGCAVRDRYNSVVAWTSVSLASAAGGAAATLLTGVRF